MMQQGNCQYKYSYLATEQTCPHPPLEDDTLCLFHSKDDKKDIRAFWNGIEDKLDKKDFDFQGYYFPSGCEIIFIDRAFENANFYSAIFKGNIWFNKAKFSGENTYFRGTKFSGKHTLFTGAKFSGQKIDFVEAVFSGEYTGFSKAEFSADDTNFIGAKFSADDTDFAGAEFSGKNTLFNWAKFSRENTYFRGTKFSGRNTDFGRAEFLGGVTFHTVRLENCRFYDTDLRRAKFIRCDFARMEGCRPFSWLGESLSVPLTCLRRIMEYLPATSTLGGLDSIKRQFSRIDEKISSLTMRTDVLRDEIAADEETKGPQIYKLIARSYQQLKRYFQDEERDYARAGEFYYGEMECKRKAGLYWPFLHLYWLLSGHGERYLRALGWLLFYIFFLFPTLYYWKADPSYETFLDYDEFRECILHSINVIALRFQETEIK